jgi:hypothetical protein
VVAVVLRVDVPDTLHGRHFVLSLNVTIHAFRTLSLVVRSLGIARSEFQERYSNRVTTIWALPRKIGEQSQRTCTLLGTDPWWWMHDVRCVCDSNTTDILDESMRWCR